MNFAKYFTRGLKSTLRLLNGVQFSYHGPWISAGTNTVIDEWFVGDFASADYTISVDYDTTRKEAIKCLVVACPHTAQATVYARTNTGTDLVEITASVDAGRVYVKASKLNNLGGKLIFSVNYYKTINELSL